MTKGELIRDFGKNSSMPIGVKRTETAQNTNNSIFGGKLSPKIEELVDKGNKIYENFNNDFQIKRDERIRKEMEEKNLKPDIDSELIDMFIGFGKDIKNKINSLFGKKE